MGYAFFSRYPSSGTLNLPSGTTNGTYRPNQVRSARLADPFAGLVVSDQPALRKLAALFEQNYDSYLSVKYNETQLRREFLDPFFRALGWDVDNEKGYAEAYKEVIHEDSIKIKGSTKAPDYAFRIGGTRKFFVEAKKPSIDIKGDFRALPPDWRETIPEYVKDYVPLNKFI